MLVDRKDGLNSMLYLFTITVTTYYNLGKKVLTIAVLSLSLHSCKETMSHATASSPVLVAMEDLLEWQTQRNSRRQSSTVNSRRPPSRESACKKHLLYTLGMIMKGV